MLRDCGAQVKEKKKKECVLHEIQQVARKILPGHVLRIRYLNKYEFDRGKDWRRLQEWVSS